MYSVLGPDNPKVKEFVQESQYEVNKWNQYVDRLNQAAGYEVEKKKVWRNPYL